MMIITQLITQSLSGDSCEGIGTSLSWNIRALHKKGGGSHLTPRTEVELKFHSWIPLLCRVDQKQLEQSDKGGMQPADLDRDIISCCS